MTTVLNPTTSCHHERYAAYPVKTDGMTEWVTRRVDVVPIINDREAAIAIAPPGASNFYLFTIWVSVKNRDGVITTNRSKQVNVTRFYPVAVAKEDSA